MFEGVLVPAFICTGIFVMLLLPTAKILRRTGHSGWWALIVLTGPGVYVGLWVLACCRWPTLDTSQNGTIDRRY